MNTHNTDKRLPIKPGGGPIGGTFRIHTLDGRFTTDPLPWDASPEVIQAALDAMRADIAEAAKKKAEPRQGNPP